MSAAVITNFTIRLLKNTCGTNIANEIPGIYSHIECSSLLRNFSTYYEPFKGKSSMMLLCVTTEVINERGTEWHSLSTDCRRLMTFILYDIIQCLFTRLRLGWKKKWNIDCITHSCTFLSAERSLLVIRHLA